MWGERARVYFSRLMDESERSRSRAGAHVGPRVRPWTRSGRRQTGLPDKEAIDRRAVRNHSFALSAVSNTPTHVESKSNPPRQEVFTAKHC